MTGFWHPGSPLFALFAAEKRIRRQKAASSEYVAE